MKMNFIPFRLRLVSLSFLIWGPLLALEALLISGSASFKLSFRNTFIGSMIALGLTLCLTLVVVSGRRWTRYVIISLAGIWIIGSLFSSLIARDSNLGFFSVFLLLFLTMQYQFLKAELNKAYLDSELKWYQLFSKPIPGLSCEIHCDKEKGSFQVTKLDADGAFLLPSRQKVKSSPAALSSTLGSQLIRSPSFPISFRFQGEKFSCKARTVLSMKKALGIGIQFLEIEGDQEKDIEDFLEKLKIRGLLPN